MTAGCTRRSSEIGQDGGQQSHRYATSHYDGQNTESRLDCSVKVNAADPGSDSDADHEADDRTASAERGRFGGKEAAEQALDAPKAFIMAKSRRRSNTQPISVERTHSAAVRMISTVAASSVDRVLPSTRASPSMIWRTGWTSAAGTA